jgi:hypothetical protein
MRGIWVSSAFLHHDLVQRFSVLVTFARDLRALLVAELRLEQRDDPVERSIPGSLRLYVGSPDHLTPFLCLLDVGIGGSPDAFCNRIPLKRVLGERGLYPVLMRTAGIPPRIHMRG